MIASPHCTPLLLATDSYTEGSLTILKMLEIASFWAKELRLAVADGLTVRTLMVRTQHTHIQYRIIATFLVLEAIRLVNILAKILFYFIL